MTETTKTTTSTTPTGREPFGTLPLEPADLAVDLRAWTSPQMAPSKVAAEDDDGAAGAASLTRRRSPMGGPTTVGLALVFDTETTVDSAQQLNIGSYRVIYRFGDKGIITLEEGLFYADNLPDRHPAGYRTLVEHAATARADVNLGRHRCGNRSRTGVPGLQLMSRHEWVERVLFTMMQQGAVIVGFNLPFDLSRIAIGAGDGRGKNYGAFSLKIWDADGFRPRIIVRSIDSQKSLISTSAMSPLPTVWPKHDCRFLDLRTLTAAISGQGYTLGSACEEWKVEHPKTQPDEHGSITTNYVDYCRRDVLATAELMQAALRVFYAYRIPGLAPDHAYSGASLAKATLRGLGVLPPLERNPDFPVEILGASMEAFYGGRSEVRTRRTHVPAEVHDFTSMYPTVNTLTGLWGLLTADTITADDATDAVRDFLESVTLEDCYQPSTWPKLVGVAQVLADGDVLPVRGHFHQGKSPVIGLLPVHSGRPTWYTIADLVASKMLTGRVPTILQATRFVGHGTAEQLTQSQLSTLTIDPAKADLFRSVIELRKSSPDPTTQALLKLIANSGAYGIFSEFVAQPHAAESPVTINVATGTERFESVQTTSERPGAYCFPPIAATITGAARLMLALLERAVTDAGGWWVFCDTDSMAIITDPDGGLVPCEGGPHLDTSGRASVRGLTRAQTAAIRQRFDQQLNPYDPAVVPNLLKLEYPATVYAVSAKRYATYHRAADGSIGHPVDYDGNLIVDKKGNPISLGKQHGVGHLLPPDLDRDDPRTPLDQTDRTWIDALWRTVLDRDLEIVDDDASLGLWDDRAALSRLAITSPHMLHLVDALNEGKSWDVQIKPLNFLSMLTVSSPITATSGALVGPYNPDPATVRETEWLSLRDGTTHRVFIGPELTDFDPNVVDVDNFGLTVRQHDRSREDKYRDVAGQPCDEETKGVLVRSPVRAAWHRYTGKEARTLDESEHLANPAETTVYGEGIDQWEHALSVLRRMKVRDIQAMLDPGGWHSQIPRSLRSSLEPLQARHDKAKTAATRNKLAAEIGALTVKFAGLQRDYDRKFGPRVDDRHLRRILKSGSRPRADLMRGLIRVADCWEASQREPL